MELGWLSAGSALAGAKASEPGLRGEAAGRRRWHAHEASHDGGGGMDGEGREVSCRDVRWGSRPLARSTLEVDVRARAALRRGWRVANMACRCACVGLAMAAHSGRTSRGWACRRITGPWGELGRVASGSVVGGAISDSSRRPVLGARRVCVAVLPYRCVRIAALRRDRLGRESRRRRATRSRRTLYRAWQPVASWLV